MDHERNTLAMTDAGHLMTAVDPFAKRPPYASHHDADLRIKAVAVHTIDHFAGLPLWRFSMSFALLKTYLAKFPFHTRTSFELTDHYETTDDARIVEATTKDNPSARALLCLCLELSQVPEAGVRHQGEASRRAHHPGRSRGR